MTSLNLMCAPWSRSTRANRFSPWPQSMSLLPRKRSKKFASISSRFPSSSIRSKRCGPADPTQERMETSGCSLRHRRPRESSAAGPSTSHDRSLKWTEADFSDAKYGRLPMGKTPDEWSYGDIDAGFKNAALVLDETFRDAGHEPSDLLRRAVRWLTGRTAKSTFILARRAPRKLVPAIARWLNIDAEQSCPHQRIYRRRIRQQDHRRAFR